jgi:hypothetical protein
MMKLERIRELLFDIEHKATSKNGAVTIRAEHPDHARALRLGREMLAEQSETIAKLKAEREALRVALADLYTTSNAIVDGSIIGRQVCRHGWNTAMVNARNLIDSEVANEPS